MEATHVTRKTGLSVPSHAHTSTPHTAGQLGPCSDGDLSTASGHMFTHGESTKDWMTLAPSGTQAESYCRTRAIYEPANMNEQCSCVVAPSGGYMCAVENERRYSARVVS